MSKKSIDEIKFRLRSTQGAQRGELWCRAVTCHWKGIPGKVSSTHSKWFRLWTDCGNLIWLVMVGIEPIRTPGLVPWRKEQFQRGDRYVSADRLCSTSDHELTPCSSVSTLRSALELKAVFDKLQLAEQSGLPAEEMRKLEEQAAEQGIRTLWKVSSEGILCCPADIFPGSQARSRERGEGDLREDPFGYKCDCREASTARRRRRSHGRGKEAYHYKVLMANPSGVGFLERGEGERKGRFRKG